MNNHNRSIKEICQANSKFNIIKHKIQSTSSYLSVNNQQKDHSKIDKRQKSQQRKFSKMEDYRKDLQNLYNADAMDSVKLERQLLDKENYLKLCDYNNIPNGKNNETDVNNKRNNILPVDCYPLDKSNNGECLQNLTKNRSNPHCLEQQQQATVYSVDNIDRDKDQDNNTHDGADRATDRDVEGDEEEDVNNSEVGRSRTTLHSDEFLNENTINPNKAKVNDKSDKDCKAEDEEENDNFSSHLKLLTAPLQTQAALAAFVETQTTATATSSASAHLQSTGNHQQLCHQQFINDVGQQILNGQQIRVQNIIDVAGNLCAAEPIGALCDMAAFSKMDCSPHEANQKDEVQNSPDFLAKKYYHPLYAHGVCRWPGCELPLEDMATFVKYLTQKC